MGELVTMKEEFRDIVDKVIQYFNKKQCISQDVAYDIDSIVDAVVKGQELLVNCCSSPNLFVPTGIKQLLQAETIAMYKEEASPERGFISLVLPG